MSAEQATPLEPSTSTEAAEFPPDTRSQDTAETAAEGLGLTPLERRTKTVASVSKFVVTLTPG